MSMHSCFVVLGYCAFMTASLAILQWYIEGCQRKVVADIKLEFSLSCWF
jgi:solute carrier family 25 (mitochondrial S-adenosylmethionine transporter), member 26